MWEKQAELEYDDKFTLSSTLPDTSYQSFALTEAQSVAILYPEKLSLKLLNQRASKMKCLL